MGEHYVYANEVLLLPWIMKNNLTPKDILKVIIFLILMAYSIGSQILDNDHWLE
jgi:hypothetical protein